MIDFLIVIACILGYFLIGSLLRLPMMMYAARYIHRSWSPGGSNYKRYSGLRNDRNYVAEKMREEAIEMGGATLFLWPVVVLLVLGFQIFKKILSSQTTRLDDFILNRDEEARRKSMADREKELERSEAIVKEELRRLGIAQGE